MQPDKCLSIDLKFDMICALFHLSLSIAPSATAACFSSARRRASFLAALILAVIAFTRERGLGDLLLLSLLSVSFTLLSSGASVGVTVFFVATLSDVTGLRHSRTPQ